MWKLNSLRDHITAALPELAREPDALSIYATDGRVAARLGGSLGFENRYNATLFLLNFRGDPAQIFLPLLSWLSVNQADLLLNHQTGVESIAFSVDVIDQETVDVEIKVPLTETVRVEPDGAGGYRITPIPEPTLPDFEPLSDPLATLRQIYAPGGAAKEMLVGYPEG